MTQEERIFQAEQESGQQIALHKLPVWAQRSDILYPVRLSMEQCSSEATAQYKMQLLQEIFGLSCTENVLQKSTQESLSNIPHSLHLVDLTGGFGVDAAYLSTLFTQTDYVEQNEALCQIAQHNFQALNLNIQVHHQIAEEFLATMPQVDCIFIDPARRDNKGGKVFKIEDCTPNIVELHNFLLSKTRFLLIKLSPMLDVQAALQAFPETIGLHIVSYKNECKELLLVVQGHVQTHTHASSEKKALLHHEEDINTDFCPLTCVELQEKYSTSCTFSRSQEANASAKWAIQKEDPSKPYIGTYLYEPGAALLKAGGFKWLSAYYGIAKLHLHSHLYTSDQLIPDFPGKVFKIEQVLPVHKKNLNGLKKANLSIRNFPGTVANLRKKLGIQEGGEVHLFATTLYNEQKVLIQTQRLFLNKTHNNTTHPLA